MANPKACRVVIACRTGLLGRGLQSLLERDGAFEVAALVGPKEDVAAAIRDRAPGAIKEGGRAAGQSPLVPPRGGALKDDDMENVARYLRSIAE